MWLKQKRCKRCENICMQYIRYHKCARNTRNQGWQTRVEISDQSKNQANKTKRAAPKHKSQTHREHKGNRREYGQFEGEHGAWWTSKQKGKHKDLNAQKEGSVDETQWDQPGHDKHSGKEGSQEGRDQGKCKSRQIQEVNSKRKLVTKKQTKKKQQQKPQKTK